MNGSRESGTTAIIVAVALLLLMGFASLAIDASLGFDDRRGTQNAADLAALAAAYEECNPVSGSGGPVTVGRQTAADNGYPHDPSVGQMVSVVPVGVGTGWTVQIATRNEATFGGATPYAPDQLDIVSEATASCTRVGIASGFALFSKADSCPGIGGDLSVSSADVMIDGSVHGNEDVKITGSSPDVTGEVTYRGNENTSSPVEATKYYGSALDYPVTLAFNEFDAGDPRTSPPATPVGEFHDFGSAKISAASIEAMGLGTFSPGTLVINQPGIYRTAGTIDLKTVDVSLSGDALTKGVTFVSRGSIDMKSLSNVNGYAPLVAGGDLPILMFSDDGSERCNEVVISISGNSVTWGGLIFAPKGGIKISTAAADTVTMDGSIIGYTVNLAAGTFNLTYDDDSTSTPSFRVELVD